MMTSSSQIIIPSPSSSNPALHHPNFITASTGSSSHQANGAPSFQSIRTDEGYYRTPPPSNQHAAQSPPSLAPPPGMIGGKFIFKSNVIQNQTEMSPPFLVMKPQAPASSTTDSFPNGRVVLIPGRNYSPPPPPSPQITSAIPQSASSSSSTSPTGTGKWVPPNPSSLNGISSSSGSNGNLPSSSPNGRGSSNGGSRMNNGGKLGSSSSSSAASKKDLFTQRKQREFIPDNKKDDNYWDRRRRNNEAAKRSREKRRFNDMILEQRVIELTKENHILKAQLDAIRDKYNIYGEELISLDQIMSTMPTPDQVLSVNSQTGNLTIASGLTTQHFRNFQMSREAMAAGQASPPKKIKLASSVKGEDGEDEVSRPPVHQSDNHHHLDRSPFYKHSASSLSPPSVISRHLGGGPPPVINKSPPATTPIPSGLINYSLRDIYYNSNSSSSNQNNSTSPNLARGGPSHVDTQPANNAEFPFHNNHLHQYSSGHGEGHVKYEDDPEVGPSRTPPYHHQPSSHHHPAHHLINPVHLPKPIDFNNNNSNHYYFEENRARRRKWEDSVGDEEEEAAALIQKQRREMVVGSGHFSQLELILNLSAKREHEDDGEHHHRDDEPEPSAVERESPVLVAAKNHSNLLPLKLRHKNNFSGSGSGAKHELVHHGGGIHLEQLRSRVVHHMDDDEVDSHHLHSHHHHHHHHENNYDDDEDVKSHVDDGIEDEEDERGVQHQRRVHCCIEVEKLPSASGNDEDDEDDNKPTQSTSSENGGGGGGPKTNNIQLKTQLARLENEMATIKNMMYMNNNQATAAAQ